MPQTHYRILFQGKILANFTPQQVQDRLALLCQRRAAELDRLFSGQSFWLQENLSGQAAIAYRRRLADIGAHTDIYYQHSKQSADSFPLSLTEVEYPQAHLSWLHKLRRRGVAWALLGVLLIVGIWPLLAWLTAEQEMPPDKPTKAMQPALQVPALRRDDSPAKPAANAAAAFSSAKAAAHPLPQQELADYQSHWLERLRIDLQLLQGTVTQRYLSLPTPAFLSQIIGDMPDLRLQRQGRRIQLHIPAQQRSLNQGVDQLVWQGLRGYLVAQDNGWKLRASHGELKLAALQHGWLSLSAAQIQAQLSQALQPQSLRLALPSFEISDGVKQQLSFKALWLDLELLRQGDALPIPQGNFHNEALHIRNDTQQLSWRGAFGLSAAQIKQKRLNYALHLRLDDIQSTHLTAFALPKSLQALQLTLFLRQLPLSQWRLDGKNLPTPEDLQGLEIRAHLRLLSQPSTLEAQLTLRFQPPPTTAAQHGQHWQPWLAALDIALDIECHQELLTELWQQHSGGKPLPLAYLQLHGYLRSQADNYRLNARWQDGQLSLNDQQIGGYAEYQLAQQQAQISEALSLLAGLQATLETYYRSHGRFPPNLHVLNVQTQGRYTDNISLDSQTLHIQAQLDTGVAIRLQFLPSLARWQCQIITPAEPLPTSLLPAWCHQ